MKSAKYHDRVASWSSVKGPRGSVLENTMKTCEQQKCRWTVRQVPVNKCSRLEDSSATDGTYVSRWATDLAVPKGTLCGYKLDLHPGKGSSRDRRMVLSLNIALFLHWQNTLSC